MFARFFAGSHTQDSNDASFESAFACASFFAALLLLIDTVIAVSIFVSADILAALCLFAVFGLVAVSLLHVLRVLLGVPGMKRSKPLAVSI